MVQEAEAKSAITEQSIKERDKAIHMKLLASFGAAQTELGVHTANIHKTLQILYRSLYFPMAISDKTKDGYEDFDEEEVQKVKEAAGDKYPKLDMEITVSDQFPDRDELLRKKVHIKIGEEDYPTENEFIEAMAYAITRKVDVKGALYESSLDSLKHAMRVGKVILWTAGDMYGISEPESHPGYRGQLWKLGLAGINEERREIAKEKNVARQEVLELCVSEDKMEALEGIFDNLKGEVKTVVLIDDQLGGSRQYIYDAEEMAKKRGVKFIPIWANQGIYKDRLPERMRERDSNVSLANWRRRYNAITNISELSEKLEELGLGQEEQNLIFVFDFDGTLSDDSKRQKAQSKVIISGLEERGWL